MTSIEKELGKIVTPQLSHTDFQKIAESITPVSEKL